MSIAGVCQTTVARGEGRFTVEAVPETLAHTTLGALRAGDAVNLELPLAAGDPIGGHLVAGHVDAKGEVAGLEKGPHGVILSISIPPDMSSLVVEKGSIAVDGVSLTVASAAASSSRQAPAREARVALVPYTLEHTTLGSLRRGDRVNLEADLLARYLAGLLAGRAADEGGITAEWLAEHGYGTRGQGRA